MRTRSVSAAVLLSVIVTAPTRGQSEEHRSVMRSTCGVGMIDGEYCGIGADYKVRFSESGVEFTPAFGAAVAHNMPVRMSLASIARADGDVEVPSRIQAITRDGESVRYERGAITEIYEIRAGGVKQSFEFRSLPKGAGDLVVRVAVASELTPCASAESNCIEFACADVGAVTVREVVGIDASGVRCAGKLSFDRGHLELTLPSEFVDVAELPLIVDPLIGARVDVNGAFDDRGPDVAFDATTGRYLVVWSRQFSAGDSDVRGQRLDGDANLVGSTIFLDTSVGLSVDAQVANIALRDAFVVTFSKDSDVIAVGVSADDGSIIDTLTVAGGSDVQIQPDVCGEATGIDDDVVVVWRNVSENRLELAQVTVTLQNTMSTFDLTTLAGGGSQFFDRRPALPKSMGANGRFALVFEQFLSSINTTDIKAHLLDRNLTVLDQLTVVAFSRCANPEVDGDGGDWVVAFERADIATDVTEIFCRHLTDSSGQLVAEGSEEQVTFTTTRDNRDPAVAWLGDSVVVAYAEESAAPNEFDVFVASIDPFGCTVCELEQPIEVTPFVDSTAVSIAAKLSASISSNSGEALIVWDSRSGGDSDTKAVRFRADDGLLTDLGGGCGAGGEAFATCARSVNANFRHRLRGARPNAVTFLMLSVDTIDVPCGSCTLVADPFLGFVADTTTDANGNAEVLMPFTTTALAGIRFVGQWATTPDSSGCALSADLSSAFRAQIQ